MSSSDFINQMNGNKQQNQQQQQKAEQQAAGGQEQQFDFAGMGYQAAMAMAFGGNVVSPNTGWIGVVADVIRKHINEKEARVNERLIVKDVPANHPVVNNRYPFILIGKNNGASMSYAVFFYTHGTPAPTTKTTVPVNSTTRIAVPGLPTDDIGNVLANINNRLGIILDANSTKTIAGNRVHWEIVHGYDSSDVWAREFYQIAENALSAPQQRPNLATVFAIARNADAGCQISLATNHNVCNSGEEQALKGYTGTTEIVLRIKQSNNTFDQTEQRVTATVLGTVEWRIDWVLTTEAAQMGSGTTTVQKRAPMLVICGIRTNFRDGGSLVLLFNAIISTNDELRRLVATAQVTQANLFSGMMDPAGFNNDDQYNALLNDKGMVMNFPEVMSKRAEIIRCHVSDKILVAIEATVGGDQHALRNILGTVDNPADFFKEFAKFAGINIDMNNVPKTTYHHKIVAPAAIVETSSGPRNAVYYLNAATVAAFDLTNSGGTNRELSSMYAFAVEGNGKSNQDVSLALQADVLSRITSAGVRYQGEMVRVIMTGETIRALAVITNAVLQNAKVTLEQSSIPGQVFDMGQFGLNGSGLTSASGAMNYGGISATSGLGGFI